jgi:predicted transcriptional regulator
VFLGGNTNYFVNNLQLTIITSLPVVSTVFSIWKIRQAKKKTQEGVVSNSKRQPNKRSIALANTIRFIALISFCSVIHEYTQLVLTFILDAEFRTIRMYAFSVVLDAIVAAYAIWLLICFARKEFVQLGGQKESSI